MLNTPFSPWPSFTDEEIRAVAQVIGSNRVNYWTGQECQEFEREFGAAVGSPHAVALFNGTVALEAALEALGVGPGDEVVVTPRTFLASVSCVVMAGATPVFADVDSDSGNITPATIAAVITPRTRAVICVHLAGWPCDMPGIMDLAQSAKISVIEDCAQAHGARCGDQMVGTIGDIGAWSFCQDKIMTTGGEGGMVTTNDEALWSRIWSYKDHGKSWEAVYERKHPPGFRWLHESFGTNLRMLEVQAAIGRIQLRCLADWTAQRTRNAGRIAEAAARHGSLRVPLPDERFTHAFYRLYAYVEPAALKSGWDRDRIIAEIEALGVPSYQGSCSEVYLEKAFDGTGLRPSRRLPVARSLGETSIMFLVHPTLTEDEVEKTCMAIDSVMTRVTR
jgi:dTDP-4-amino-4,6-dideoxygalactose transaminase